MKNFFAAIAFLLLASTTRAACSTLDGGVTYSCPAAATVADVQAAVTGGVVGPIGPVITLAFGTYSGTGVKFSNSKGTTIICATAPLTIGAATTNPCTWNNALDKVFYNDGFAPGVNNNLYRVSGITFDGGGSLNLAAQGVVFFDSYSNNTFGTMELTNVRVDHNTFQNYKTGSNAVGVGNSATSSVHVYGVVDHNQLANATMTSVILWVGTFDTWPPADPVGTSSNLFFEDNNFNFTAVGGSSVEGCTDGWGSMSVVVRHNTAVNCLMTEHGWSHQWGPYNYELYSNNISMNASSGSGAEWGCYRCFHSQGAAQNIFFNNTFTPANWSTTGTISMGTPTTLTVASATGAVVGGTVNVAGAGPSSGTLVAQITNIAGLVLTIDTGASFGVSGAATTIYYSKDREVMSLLWYGAEVMGYDIILPQVNGFLNDPITKSYMPSGNHLPQSANRGYPGYSQPGRDPATQKLKPDYVWNNVWAPNNSSVPLFSGALYGSGNFTFQMKTDRDWYNPMGTGGVQTSASSPFDGTSGTGFGTLANRPTTCTTNVNETGGGVGYFATDQGTQGILYRCTGNAWVVQYKPYIYPHPLVAGSAIAVAPTSNVASGGYAGTQTVTMTSATAGASIFCSTDKTYPQNDGSGNPLGTTILYSTPLTISSSTSLNCVAAKSGLVDSPDSFYVFRINETPFAPWLTTPGQFTSAGMNMSINHGNPFLHSCYRKDGIAPTATAITGVCGPGSTTGQVGGLTVVAMPANSTTVVKALLTGPGFNVGPVATATYVTGPGTNGLTFQGPITNGPIDFGSQATTTTSQPYTVAVMNPISSTSSVTLNSMSITGTVFTDAGTGSCSYPKTLITGNPGDSGIFCTIDLNFTPTAATTYNETLSISDTAGNSPHTIALTGVGVGSTPAVDTNPQPPGNLFGNQPVGVTSGNQSVTLCNGTFSGNTCNAASATLTITSITLTGANPSMFSIFSNPCGASLAPGATCVINVNFTPTAAASYTANLHFITNAGSSPDDQPLSGTGVPSTGGTGQPSPFGLVGMLWKNNKTGVLTKVSCRGCGLGCFACFKPGPMNPSPKIILW